MRGIKMAKFNNENTEGYSESDLECLNEMWYAYRKDERYSEWDDQNLSEKIMDRFNSSQGWDLGDPP